MYKTHTPREVENYVGLKGLWGKQGVSQAPQWPKHVVVSVIN